MSKIPNGFVHQVARVKKWIRDHWLEGKRGREWFCNPYFDLYIRIGPRHGKPMVVDLSNLSITESLRGQGLFKAMLHSIEQVGLPIFFENVLEERLIPFYEKRGYIRTSDEILCFFYKGVDNAEDPQGGLSGTGQHEVPSPEGAQS